jgi:hypothetical protein
MRILTIDHRLLALVAGACFSFISVDSALGQFRGGGLYFSGPGSLGVGVGSVRPPFGVGSTQIGFGVGYPGFAYSGLGYQMGIPAYRPLGYRGPGPGFPPLPPPFPIPPRPAIIVPELPIYRDVYSARVPYQQPSVPYQQPSAQYQSPRIVPESNRGSSVTPRSSVPLNPDGTPAGELRPGMVLPDGAIVLSVGPSSSQPSLTQSPKVDPNPNPSPSSLETQAPKTPAPEPESIEPEAIPAPAPTSKID